MSSRPPRPPSMPLRNTVASSPARNIETVISIPSSIGTAQPRPRTASSVWSARSGGAHEQRSLGLSYGTRLSNANPSNLLTRPSARSLTYPVAGRGPSVPPSAYEPRVIRADSMLNPDIACPSSSSVSPSRTRRPSATRGTRASSSQRSSAPPSTLANSDLAPFPRPAYLEHSALRDLLHTEVPSSHTPRTAEPASRTDYPSGLRGSRRSPSVDSDEDDLSPPRELRKSPPPTVPASLLALSIPTRWCEEMRSPLLTVSGDGKELLYQGTPSANDKDTATARTAVPIPPACGIYYFEVELVGKAQKRFIGREVKLSRLPGWEKNSWGYHGESVGDIIGCGVDLSQNKVFYTKNGSLIGTVFDNVGKDGDIFPAVGLSHIGESIRANFGQESFKYDIEDHVHQQRNQTWAKIQSFPLKWPSESKPSDGTEPVPLSVSDESVKIPINELVLTYLSHHGYARTARAFEVGCNVRGGLISSSSPKTMPAATSSTLAEDYVMVANETATTAWPSHKPSKSLVSDDIEIRTHIVHSVIAGDIDTALMETEMHFPAVLEADAGIMLFKLRCRKFVELVLEAAELKKKMRAEECGMSIDPAIYDDAHYSNGVKSFADGMDMDVDDEEHPGIGMRNLTNSNTSNSHIDIPPAISRKSSPSTSAPANLAAETAIQYGTALEKAVMYGQELEADYKHRSEVRAIFKRTSVIMAYYDPLEAGGDAAEVAGQSARVTLATELNQAILQSQGRPAQPLLDKLYRQTAVCLTQLALIGNGSAAFADMQKELLDA
ncbi:hypothetical protein J3A83DRAFT_4359253 [Scleroderma citrinum]